MTDRDPVPTTASAMAGRLVPGREAPAVLVLDTTSGRVVASSPAARRRLAAVGGEALGAWLAGLATAAEHPDVAVVRSWPQPRGAAAAAQATGEATGEAAGKAAGEGTGRPALAAPVPDGVVRVVTTRLELRARTCLLVALRDAGAPLPLPPGVADGRPAADPACALFTLDPLGRVDSWGTAAQSLLGYRPEHVLGADTSLLLPPATRAAGEQHRALTQAYRTGEHRAEGWRRCGDRELLWAEVATVPLHDPEDRFVGFAQVVQDLTPTRRVAGSDPSRAPGRRVPADRPVVDLRAVPVQRTSAAPSVASAAPAPSRPATVEPARAGRRAGLRVPAQRARRP